MKTFVNINPASLKEAVAALKQPGAHVAGGGTDLLQLMKERIVAPDTLVHLRAIPNMDKVTETKSGVTIGSQITLDALSRHPLIASKYKVLAEAAGSVGTPQIRNAGTLGGNINQRPWCWYYRNGFKCLKNGGNICYSAAGENQFHAIFGAGPSFIVHPSDTAVALVALGAKFKLVSPAGERTVAAADYFALPRVNAAKENVLATDEILSGIALPTASAKTQSTYHKVLDREAWTHAVVSAAIVLEMDKGVCKQARIVLGGVAPIPWRLDKVEAMLTGKKVTEALAREAAEAALHGARPLTKNKYKVPLTKAIVRRTLLQLAAG